ncbi:acyl carrier protein [Asanoa iriomotensis]|uniref:Actinorhodin polyketide synthase acyl carrier protein n=1 Tax=Asanoa iriomotensis TaxID=234613 RepID=A0ABQ4C0X5_9ACTN|nr:acyl carrier protein [Asanoa iriomotensis]GIF56436.1 actinorhodin polyketide synthase acyl carrier protein [Asanoa iriomotensis]
MDKINLDDVRRLLRECAGVDDAVDLDDDIAHREFTDLGYDSLAVLEVTARIQQEYGVKVPEDDAHLLTTPIKLVEFVNTRAVTA